MRHYETKQQGHYASLCFAVMVISLILSFSFCLSANAETITYRYYDTGELKKGSYSTGTVIEYSYDSSGNRLTQIIAAAKSVISVSPASLSFGSVIIGSTDFKSITVTNTGDYSFEVESVSLSGDSSSEFSITSDTCTGASVAASGSCAPQEARQRQRLTM
jgi:hypothetical protein